jgi:hypothetical protein
MTMIRNSVMAGVVITSLLLMPHMASAQNTPANAPVHVVVGKPLTPMTDVLASISKQAGVPILTDDTVVDTVGVTTIDKPSVEEMLTALVPLGQGLSWQRVELPQDGPLPSGSILSSQVRALKTIAATGLVVVDPTASSAISFSKSATATPAAPAGMRTVYLVTNEVVRAQRLAQKAADAKKMVADSTAPVNGAVNGMSSAADDLGRMTPDQQREAIPLMFQQMMRMFQNIDPAIKEEMRKQFQGRMGQGGGGLPGQ